MFSCLYIHKIYIPVIYIISQFRIPWTLVPSLDNASRQNFITFSIKNDVSFKKCHQLLKEVSLEAGMCKKTPQKPLAICMGILCSYLLYSMKNILTMAAPASHGTCVHDTEHLLKETHSPTHTVNFCKYYKGKNLFFIVSRLLANFFKKGTLDWFAAFGYIFNEEEKYCRLA